MPGKELQDCYNSHEYVREESSTKFVEKSNHLSGKSLPTKNVYQANKIFVPLIELRILRVAIVIQYQRL